MSNDLNKLERIEQLGSQLLAVVGARGITAEQLVSDVETQWLVTTPLLSIGEQANRLSDELIARFPDVPWLQVAGLRHRLVHNYENTNWEIVASILFDDMAPFLKQVADVVDRLRDSNQQEEESPAQ